MVAICTGPIFDGRAQAAAAAFVEDAKTSVAAQAYAEWMTLLDWYIQYPTPYYETQITTTARGGDRIVHDRGIIYGPWLEQGHGKGRHERPAGNRNRRQRPRRHTGRFRGYHAARQATAILEGKKSGLVQNALLRHIKQMG